MSASKFDVAKVREMLGAIPSGRTVVETDMDESCCSLFNAAPTLLAAACDRIVRLERVAEAARMVRKRVGDSRDEAKVVIALDEALSALDADDAEVK